MVPQYSVISDAAADCQQSFKRCITMPYLMENEWAENKLADFNLWLDGAGCYAKERASLNCRLEPEPDIKAVIINLLRTLRALLDDCCRTAQNVVDICPVNLHLGSVALRQDYDGTTLAMPAESSSNESTARNENTVAVLKQNINDVEAILKELFKLIVVVRKIVAPSRHQRADDHFDSTAHQELRYHLQTILLGKLQENEAQPFRQEGMKLSKIQWRLIEANVRRRSRFLYQQRHLGKFSVKKRSDVKSNKHEGTTAPKTHESAKTAKKSATTVVPPTITIAGYPEPPKLALGNRPFKCPCCCQALGIETAQKDEWRKHLDEDIQPYTCILENCPEPWNFFEDRNSWLRHMKTEHEPLKYWRCPDICCKDQRQFELEADFVSHLQTQHNESVSKKDIPLLVSVCCYLSPAEIRFCPICPQESLTTDITASSLLDHVADHVHSFSLRSLPWAQNKGNISWIKRVIRDLKTHFKGELHFELPDSPPTPTQYQGTYVDPVLEIFTTDDEQSSGARSNTVLPDSDSRKFERDELRMKLHEARIEYPPESLHFFVPDSEKAAIITEEVIAREIYAARPCLGHSGAQNQAKLVRNEAMNLFAILAYLRKGQEICAFLEEGILDKDLPFERSRQADRRCKFSLQLKDGRPVKVLDEWKPSELESMGRKQWYMLAPVFKDTMEHYVLHKNIVLPFMSEENGEEHTKNSGGGYSEVFTVRIHTAHHRFHHYFPPWAQQHTFAVKRLHNYDQMEFDNERRILATLGKQKNASPHLIRLLATYDYQGRYHFIFPKADCNLREYWANNPAPPVMDKLFLWSLKQMGGIARALDTVHNFSVPTSLKGKAQAPSNTVEDSVEEDEQLFGRHGDIKPENILWIQQMPASRSDAEDEEGGILQITDFGLGQFHGRDSRTQSKPNGVFGSPTYEPPECRLYKPISQSYDLWTLGCVYLEFATWLLMGSDAIEGFSDHRARTSSINPNFSEDYFYTIVRDDEGRTEAKVRDGVIDWAQKLHAHEKCSNFIHDVVDLVMENLLVVDAKERIHAPDLCDCFDAFLKRAKDDHTYLCNPNPRTTEQQTPRLVPAPKRALKDPLRRTPRPRKTHSKKKPIQFRTASYPGSIVAHRSHTRNDQ